MQPVGDSGSQLEKGGFGGGGAEIAHKRTKKFGSRRGSEFGGHGDKWKNVASLIYAVNKCRFKEHCVMFYFM